MVLVESLQKAIEYMEEHLLDAITIEDIAAQANVSPFHFQRTFMILTDTSVAEYMRRRRLTLAAQELSTTDGKIIDLAYKYGYDSPEAFTKAFRKQHGISPSEARKGGGKLQSYNRLIIQVNLKGAEPMNYQIVERAAFQVIGLKRECPCGEEGGGIPEFWGEANGDGTTDKLLQLMNGEIKGLLGITDNYNAAANTIDYWIAAEYMGEVPSGSGFASLAFPASKWVVFEVHGPAPTAMPEAWKQIYSEWIPSNGYEIADIAAIEAYTDSNPYRADSSNQIWLAVK